MRLDSDDFSLFGLPPHFALDRAELDAQWRRLQAEVHPDRFTSEGTSAQRIAMQWAVRVNEAYTRLKDPLRRAAYLCELRGVPIAAETRTAMPAAFMMQQLQWREALDEADSLADVERLSEELLRSERLALADLAEQLDLRQDSEAAAAQVRALMFNARFRQTLERRLDALDATR
ncbi:MAG: Fe-S protein assembly co-chaperone HscB [Chitinophagaceae bacterium]|nr:Fe-S protein assembly co-chaperone HscB [Rubrivivax sp.]